MASFKYVVVSVIWSVVAPDERYSLNKLVVEGKYGSIENNPHSVFIKVKNPGNWGCGASVLNQVVLLTAAHCTYNIKGNWFQIHVFAGHENRKKSTAARAVKKFYMHKDYDEETCQNDIALLHVEGEMPLGDFIKRVLISNNFPTNKLAIVSGWGVTNDVTGATSIYLKEVKQQILDGSKCDELQTLLPGDMCTQSVGGRPSSGDSGSALMIQYQQIGIVSFTYENDLNIIFHTNVSYYYTWIKQHAASMFCNKLK